MDAWIFALASCGTSFPFSDFIERPSLKEMKNEKHSPEFYFTFTVLNLPETILILLKN
jgi:hypothetical protein